MTAAADSVTQDDSPPAPDAKPSGRSPIWWVPSLYMAQSLPFNAVILVSVMMYKSLGLSDSQIAFWTSWLLVPWTLKPFWSPLIEMYRTKKVFVIGTQVLAGAGFGVMAFLLPLPFNVQLTLGMFFIMAFNSATHDIASDGLYIDALDKEGQAKYVGLQAAFWNIGQVIAQGGLLILAGVLERSYGVVPAWMMVWGIFAVLMVVFGLYHSGFLPAGRASSVKVTSVGETLGAFSDVTVDLFLKKNVWWYIAFALVYRSAEGQIEKIAQLFLRGARDAGGLGLGTAEVGLVYGTFGTVGMVVGAMVGGWYASKVGLKKSLLPLALIFNIPNALFTYLAFAMPEPFVADITWYGGMFPVIDHISNWNSFLLVSAFGTIEKFALGMGFTSMILVLMQQMSAGRFSTAHYAIATALMNVGMMVPSMTSGYVSDSIGYQGFFVYILFAGIPSIAISAALPIMDDPKSAVIPDGKIGDLTKRMGLAIGFVAASGFLLISFYGLVGAEVSLALQIVFGLLTAAGVYFAVKAIGKARAAMAERVDGDEGIRAKLGWVVLASVVALTGWAACVGYLAWNSSTVYAARSACASKQDTDACWRVCQNDGDLGACRTVAKARAGAIPMDAEKQLSDDEKAAAGEAWEAHRLSLEMACLNEEQPAACNELGDTFMVPGRWSAAEVHRNLEEAERYYRKGCRLKDEKACAQVKVVVEQSASERKAPVSSGGGGH